jgi:hypothetical protein
MSSGTFDPAKEIKPVDPNVAAPIAVDKVFALFHDKDGDCKNARRADVELVAWAADKGDARAMFLMGEINDDGCEGFDADGDAANDWYHKSAEAGDPWGMASYGMKILDKAKEEKNGECISAAKEWIAKAWVEFGCMGELTFAMSLLQPLLIAKCEMDADDSPDISRLAALSEAILRVAGDVDSDSISALDRNSMAFAHMILANIAKQNDDIAAAREHFEKGAVLGDKDCQEALDELECDTMEEDNGENGDDEEEEDGGDYDDDENEDVEYVARRGPPSNVSFGHIIYIPLCPYGSTARYYFSTDVVNNSDHDTGSLSLQLWFFDKEYTGGEFSGYRMAERMYPSPLHGGQCYTKYVMDGVMLTCNPPTGDYFEVLTLNELNDDGTWHMVDCLSAKKSRHWDHYED